LFFSGDTLTDGWHNPKSAGESIDQFREQVIAKGGKGKGKGGAGNH